MRATCFASQLYHLPHCNAGQVSEPSPSQLPSEIPHATRKEMGVQNACRRAWHTVDAQWTVTCGIITGQRHTLLHGWGRRVPTQAKSSQTVLLKGAAICYNSVPEKSQPGLWLLGGGPGSPPPDWHLQANVIQWPNHHPLKNPLLCLPASVFAPFHLVFFFFLFWCNHITVRTRSIFISTYV